MSDFKRRNDAHRKPVSLSALLVLAGGLLIILYSTLKPFDFEFRLLTVGDYVAGYDILPDSLLDFPRNILLFVPIGFGIAAILDQRGWSRSRIRLVILICGFLLTLTVESLQQFLPSRQPSVADIIANTIGALAGLACFRLWQNREATAEWLDEILAMPRRVLAALAIYVLLLLSIAYGLSSVVWYHDWDPDYRIMLGNEQTGDRQWLGSVRDLVIYNRALETGEARALLKDPDLALLNDEGLLAFYPLAGGSTEQDLTGKQPDLSWQPISGAERNGRTVQFDGRRWLATESAVEEMSEQLQETSQLTIRLTVATTELEQRGPARIVTISEDPFLRNLTLGQQDNDLVMRFRSRLTGENGAAPQILFPDFFTSSDPIDLVVTYDGLTIDLIDSNSDILESMEFMPGAAFYYNYIDLIVNPNPSFSQITAGTISNWFYHLLFYTIIFLPLGILLSLRAVTAWQQGYRIILLFCGLLVIPLLLEILLVYRSGQDLRPVNVVTSVLVIGLIAWVFVPLVRQLISVGKTAHTQRVTGSR